MMKICHELHMLTDGLRRFRFPFDEKKIPSNGIYILFETNERAHGTDRIVHIGTHTGDNQLRSRIKEHFLKENKDRSIFRKNIGRAVLNRDKDMFLEQWEWDLTSKKAKDKHAHILNCDKQKETEKRVSDYMRSNLSFAAFQVNVKADRLSLESRMISTVSICDQCKPSDDWLGLHSPKNKIRESGLWLVNELYKAPLTEEDFKSLELLCM